MRIRYDFTGWLRNAWDTLFTSRYEKHLLDENRWLKSELESTRFKLEKMELAIMPLASREGAAYARSVSPSEPKAKIAEKPESLMSWPELQAHHALKMQQETEKDAIRQEIKL